MKKNDKIEGGLADNLSLEEIAKKHNVSIEQIKAELTKGVKVELEHTSDKEIAKEIATDHLAESPTYYTDLAKIEKVDESYSHIKNFIKTRIREFLNEKKIERNIIRHI